MVYDFCGSQSGFNCGSQDDFERGSRDEFSACAQNSFSADAQNSLSSSKNIVNACECTCTCTDPSKARIFADFVNNPGVKANNQQIIQGDRFRITVITDSLIRLEWSDDGNFVDAPTQMVVCRDFSSGNSNQPKFCAREDENGWLEVETDKLLLSYNRKSFSKEGLSIVVRGVPCSQFNTWHYGDDCPGNLLGTARTLDEADGAIKLDYGIMSRDGWAVLDDSKSCVIVPASEVNGKPNPYGAWVKPRSQEFDVKEFDTQNSNIAQSSDAQRSNNTTQSNRYRDLYFFGYGHNYIDAIRDFYKLTGSQPLLPRFAMGNWWSRYCRYSQSDYENLMSRFKREAIPFSTAVIDMDWHITDVDSKYGSGWTGYTWNNQLFPDHKAFLRKLANEGLVPTLNLHPRDGVRAFEKDYPQVARDMGIDPASGKAVEFDLTNPRFVEAYFNMHHRMEDEGVKFWWIDWQQGGVTKQAGLDPLWMLNHMHYEDLSRDGGWPLTFSRYAGPGSHRYPVGFSGDTVTTWNSLAFQAYFTSTASNIGYGWWSHDIGGHMLGVRDNELEARWYALGAFSPINRLHSSCSPFAGKEPWNFPRETRDAMVKMLRLRASLLPYLYTMNYRAAFENRPIVEPMYWQSPEVGAAYEMPQEYRFGSELIVAPVVSKNDDAVTRGCAGVWLPAGDWYDFFDGRRYASRGWNGRRFEAWRALDRVPAFARAGAIVPMQVLPSVEDCARSDEAAESVNSVENPRSLRVLAFPGADGEFVMREDNGRFEDACAGKTADTSMRFVWRDGNGSTQFVIDAAKGCDSAVVALPSTRDWSVVFRGVACPDFSHVRVFVGDSQLESNAVEVSYEGEESTLSLTVCVRNVPVCECVRVIVDGGLCIAQDPKVGDAYRLLLQAQVPYRGKEMAFDAIREAGGSASALSALSALEYEREEQMIEQQNSVDMVNAHACVQPSVVKWAQWRCTLPGSVKRALEEILLRSAE